MRAVIFNATATVATAASDATGWRDFLELLSDPVVVVDRAGHVVSANPALLRLAPCVPGLPLSQLQGLLGAAALTWLDRASVGLTRASVASAGPLVQLADGRSATLAWRRLDAQHGALHLTLAPPLADAAAAAAAEHTDGTRREVQQIELERLARDHAERAVATQAERTRAILDSVLVGIVTVGPHGIEWMNRSAQRMFGGELADFLDQPIGTVAPPQPTQLLTDSLAHSQAHPAHPFLRTDYLTTLVEGAAETCECRLLARDGRDFWIVGNVVSTGRSAGGRQLTYALLDIERRRDAEERMSQAQAQLQRLIEAAPLAITLRDARTLQVLRVNEVAAGNVNSTPDALIGCSPEQMYGAELGAQRRRDMELALASTEVTTHEYRSEVDGEVRIWDARYLPLARHPGAAPDQLLLVATNVTEQRVAQEARFEAAMAQRDMLVKEVHHRIKNNLQGVAGLLQQIAQRKPEVAGAISEVVCQVQAIAQVYGLQVGESGPLQLMSVTQAITVSVQRTFGRTIRFEVRGDAPHEWTLPEAESIPIALTLNELLTNAVKHSAALPESDPAQPVAGPLGRSGTDAERMPGSEEKSALDTDVVCTLDSSAGGVELRISNLATLQAGFSLARIPSGVSGLGLVRALLPRRSASLSLAQDGPRVVATVALRPPGVVRSGAA